MNPLVEGLIHSRIDADLHYKSLTLSGNVDVENPDGGLVYVTKQATEELRKLLRPYVEYKTTNNTSASSSIEKLAEKYLELFKQ